MKHIIHQLIKMLSALMVSGSLAGVFLCAMSGSILWTCIFFLLTAILAVININVDNYVDN